MANREELQIIRAARAGEAAAQLELGQRYLFGGAGLPKSLPTALYWLDRSARQDEQDAWMLIGRYVPFETVQQVSQPGKLYVWYERAFDAGVVQAGLVLVKLVLSQPAGAVSDAMRNKALRALQAAAHAGIAEAQWMLAQSIGHSSGDFLTTWPGRSNAEGRRLAGVPGAANYKRAVRWLSLAAEQGLPVAWHALSKILLKPECAQRSPVDARRCLELAAQAGHGPAQLELGAAIWRARREHESGDVLAVGWLRKAQAQGIEAASQMLERIAACARPALWAQTILARLSRDTIEHNPLLIARLELAACFGLSRTETLMIDLVAADRGHCLVVDLRNRHPHCKRRLILVRTAEERCTLERVTALFERVERGAKGSEGDYRQRLYRLKSLA